MSVSKIVLIIFCFIELSCFAKTDTIDCAALTEIFRIVSLRQIRSTDAQLIDSTAKRKSYTLHFSVLPKDSVLAVSTIQYVVSDKVVHTEKLASDTNEKKQLLTFQKLEQQLRNCLPDWEKTNLSDISNEKGYIHKTLFTNFEDDTTVMLLLIESKPHLYQIELHIF